MSTKDVIYGKLKNKRLIMAPNLYLRNGDIGFQDCTLYESLGYKKVIYHHPPDNRPGYELCYSWNEGKDYIEQEWTFYGMEEDYSSELLCSIRDFNYSMDFIVDSIHKLNQENINAGDKILKENKIIEIIWKKRCLLKNDDTLIALLHRCHLNLQDFFNQLSLTSDIESLGYTIYPECIVSDMAEGKNQILPFTYIKSNLSNIYSLYNFTTLKSKSAYDMAYIYAFTLFDDLLLKFARYICNLERKWLASNTTLTFKDIVDCSSLEEVHQLLIEQKIEELSWGSYSDKLSFFNKHGINTDSVDSVLFKDKVSFISEKRNAIVHNGGIWNSVIRDKLKTNKYFDTIVVNKSVNRSVESIENECGNELRKAANDLYDLLCSKFNLINRYKIELADNSEENI